MVSEYDMRRDLARDHEIERIKERRDRARHGLSYETREEELCRIRKEKMDRFEEIQKRTYFGKEPVVGDDAHWLVQEIVRLRKIEDAALEWHRCRVFREPVQRHHETVACLKQAIRGNPRPTHIADKHADPNLKGYTNHA